jgi:cyclophilin family peptidyl-prolyl cis-trans isomerase/HEAT repeat protein
MSKAIARNCSLSPIFVILARMIVRTIPFWILIVLISGCTKPEPVATGLPADVLVPIIEAEDKRQWNAAAMEKFLVHTDAKIRARAALAAGRIGEESEIPRLAELIGKDTAEVVAAAAAFAIGEIESAKGIEPLLGALDEAKRTSNPIRAAAVEGLGKIGAALPETAAEDKKRVGAAILDVLNKQAGTLNNSAAPVPSEADRHLTLLALTAALRAKPDGAATAVAKFLTVKDERIKQDALNALARLRAEVSLDQVRNILENDADPLTRANAARVLGAAGDYESVEALVKTIAAPDLRTRVAAIRALASLAQSRSGPALIQRGQELRRTEPPPLNELREIATALGRTLVGSKDTEAIALLSSMRKTGPEVEIALSRIAPQEYVNDPAVKSPSEDWQELSAIAQGLGEIATLEKIPATVKAQALAIVRPLAESARTPERAMYDVLQAVKAFKPADLAAIARDRLKAADVITRAAAAEILSELPPSAETTTALAAAMPVALKDQQNDAALAIVAALEKSKDDASTGVLLNAGMGGDHLVRRRALAALKGRVGMSAPTFGRVNTRNTPEDYARVAARDGKRPKATITTDKGIITIELNPSEAPLTVDTFIKLAQAGYFNGLTFHRVVPNFVIQGGDPRGDGNGGPGYTIRCEINMLPYETGAVGMALSGKDTGGSQFFITHSPHPHLDGGYTVFARVASGQDVVDKIERGHKILTVTVAE